MDDQENQNNYNNIEEVAVPPAEYLKFMLLRRRDIVLSELRKYSSEKARNSTPQSFMLVSAIQTLWYDLESNLKENLDTKEHSIIKNLVFSNNVDNCLLGFRKINDYLHKKKVTKFDTKLNYNYKDIELANKIKGYL